LVVCLVVCLVACPGDIIKIQIIAVAYYCATILIRAYFVYWIPRGPVSSHHAKFASSAIEDPEADADIKAPTLGKKEAQAEAAKTPSEDWGDLLRMPGDSPIN
jgi:hypothetical protein